MSIINFWSTFAPVLASALFSPVAPLGGDHLQSITQQSQPTIAAQPLTQALTASAPDFIVTPPAVVKTVEAPRGPAKSLNRSAERRVGTECVSTCRSRWAPSH